MKLQCFILLFPLVLAMPRRQMQQPRGSRPCISKYFNKDLGPLEILLMPVGEKLWMRAWLGMHMSNLLHMEGVDLAEVTQTEAARDKRSLSQVVVLDNDSSTGQVKDLLPTDVTPNSYHLWLRPFPDDNLFRGELQINITCVQPTKSIVLRADGHLKVDRLSVMKLDSDLPDRDYISDNQSERTETHSIKILKVVWYVKKSQFEILLFEPLVKGMQYQLHLRFFGGMTGNERGIFFYNYDNTTSSKLSWFLSTLMNSGNAKRVFPCFDDPHFKATFDISVARPEGMKCISSAPLLLTEPFYDLPGWEWDHFITTPPMAVSSLAIFIFNSENFHSLYSAASHGEINLYAFAQDSELSLAQETVASLTVGISYMEKHLGVSFPLPQLNLIFLPQFASSVGNFWGIILFRSNFSHDSLLFHILTQWFGHLVTAATADNEFVTGSLAQYYSYVCPLEFTDGCEDKERTVQWPVFNFMTLYEIGNRINPGEFKKLKMVLFLRMLNQSLSEETFKRGIQLFLKYRSYSTFSEEDLWDALDIQAWSDRKLDRDMSIREIASSWLDKDFFPIINIIRNYENNSALIYQNMFVRQWPYRVKDQDDMLWWIPVMLFTPDDLRDHNSGSVIWMKEKKMVSAHHLPSKDSFILVNYNDAGMYMVNYDIRNWKMLGAYLLKNMPRGNEQQITPVGRANLFRNVWILAMNGQLPFQLALNMTLFLQYEHSTTVWKTVIRIYYIMSRKLAGTGVEIKFDRFFGDLLMPVYKRNEQFHDSHKKETQALAYYILCKAGYKPAVDRGRQQFEAWMLGSQEINEGILGAVVQWVNEDWKRGLNHVMQLLRDGIFPEKREMLLTQLARSYRKENIQRLLYLLLADPAFVFLNGELKSALSAVTNCQVFLDFLTDHWKIINERFISTPNIWQYILEQAAKKCKTPTDYKKMEEFYKTYQSEMGSAVSAVKHSLELARSSMEVVYQQIPHLEEGLNNYLQHNDKRLYYLVI